MSIVSRKNQSTENSEFRVEILIMKIIIKFLLHFSISETQHSQN